MDKNIYGHTEPKRKVIEMLSKIIKVPGTTIQPIALVGPSGVGKTRFAKILSNCLDLPFIQITLGGQNDGELLHGHGYTYSSAQPGLIIKKMCLYVHSYIIFNNFFNKLTYILFEISRIGSICDEGAIKIGKKLGVFTNLINITIILS